MPANLPVPSRCQVGVGRGATSDTQPVTPDLDSAVAEARRRFVDRRPAGREWAAARRGGAARRQHALGAACRAVPDPNRPRRRGPPVGRRRPRVRRPARRLHERPARITARYRCSPRCRGRSTDGWALGGVHRDEVQLAELVVGRFPSIDQVRFTNSGTEANLMALAAAIHHTGRRRDRRVRARLSRRRAGVRHRARARSTCRTTGCSLPYNDIAAVDAAFAEQGGDIAAVLVEPMQGSAGCFPGDPAFLAAAASPVRRPRRVARLRRGDDVAPVARRRPVAARHHARPDDARQVPRRRVLVRRLRRPTRGDGALRPGAPAAR